MEDPIFSSPDVYKPPAGDLSSPIQQDNRGSIHRLSVDGCSYNMLFTKAGFMRSGDLHKIKQFDTIMVGEVELRLMEQGRETKTIYRTGETIIIPANSPHLFLFLKDTVMAEWWDGPFECWYFRPYRQLIEEYMKNRP